MTGREPPSALRDLRPVLGARAEALELAWLTGDAKEQSEIETAAALLRKRITRSGLPLLCPPAEGRTSPAQALDGLIRIGTVQHGRAEIGPLGLHPHELCSHVCVIGRTGVGKSTLAVRVLVRLLELGIPWVAFDTKRSLRQLLALETSRPVHAVALGRDLGAALRWNPLAPPPGVPADTHRRQIVELICRTWGAGDAVAAQLDRMIERLGSQQSGAPTILEVRRALADEPLKQRESTWRQTALRVLDQLTTGPLGRVFNTRRDAVATSVLLEHHTVVELDGLTASDSAFVISSLLQQITARMQEAPMDQFQEHGLRLCMFVDEAHRLLARHDGRETPVELLLREGRSLGLGMILATQTYGGISPVALANCATWVALQCRYRSDVQTAAQGLMLRDDQKEILTSLPVGEAVIRLGSRYPNPVHIRLTPFNLPAEPVTDMDLVRAFLVGPYRAASLNIRSAVETAHAPPLHGAHHDPPGGSAVPADSAAVRPPSPETPPPEPVPRPDSSAMRAASSSLQQTHSTGPAIAQASDFEPLPDAYPDTGLLLRSVAERPLATVTQHYAAAGLPRRRGDAAKRALVESRYLVPVDVAVPEGRVVLLNLGDPARSWLRRRRVAITPTQGSPLHAYWQERVGANLVAAGWTLELEHRRDGHAFDIFARRNGATILCEIETGKSNVPANLASLSDASVDHRAVVWLDPVTIDRARVLVPEGIALLQPRGVERWVKDVSAGQSGVARG